MKKYIYYLLLFTFVVLQYASLSSCANIIPPTGGPKDTLPPVLLSALPKDSAVNFKTNKITLSFDEYVQLDNNLNDMLIVSPNPEKIPVIEGKLRTVTIKLKDSLKPNTTYSLNFGNALKDVDENNPLRNFTYVFSTGPQLATGKITGKVLLAETGEADSQLLVVLHTNLNDSAIKKLRPDYYTRLDSTGKFSFNYLPDEKFSINVLPNDYSKKYDDSTKMFAFYNEPVAASEDPKPVQLYAYEEVLAKPPAPPASSSATTKKKEQTEEDKRLKFSSNFENNEQDLLDSLDLTFNRGIEKFDSSLISFSDTTFKPVEGYKIIQTDTAGKKFTLIYPWTENKFYTLILGKESFTDSAGVTLPKGDTINFKTKSESDYGSIRLHFNNLDLSKHPVLQLVQNKVVVQSAVLTGKDWYQKLFHPGDYQIRILYDNNKNGIWDPGNYDARLQPEIVQKIPRQLTIKQNWDNEVDINL